jgi:hypothetical protein
MRNSGTAYVTSTTGRIEGPPFPNPITARRPRAIACLDGVTKARRPQNIEINISEPVK